MNEKSFSIELKEDVLDIWESILTHPFLAEMKHATLPLDKFRYYIRQDYAYLMDFARCLAMAAAKADDMETMRTFSLFLDGCITDEVERIEELSCRLDIPIKLLVETELAPDNLAYTRHILYVAFSGTIGEIIAALLPCMWTYQIIGENLAKSKAIKDNPFYEEWVSVYSSKDYAELVNKYKAFTDKYAKDSGPALRKKMREHFILSSRFEYLFWEMAYRGKNE
jgi:thiaminase/transcriptional activator TenA